MTGAVIPHHSGDDRILAFPSGCRGKTGEETLKMFGSLRAVSGAKIDELMNVHNVGEKKARLIHEHFNKGTDQAEQEKML